MRETIGFSIVGRTKTEHQANANVYVETEERLQTPLLSPTLKQ